MLIRYYLNDKDAIEMNKTQKLVVESPTIPLGIQQVSRKNQGILFDSTWRYLCITFNPQSGDRILIFSSSIVGIESELKNRRIDHYEIMPIPDMMRALNKSFMKLSSRAIINHRSMNKKAQSCN